MAMPNSKNNVTVRKLSSILNSVWTKVKNLVNAKADDTSVVHKAGVETITGVKTFSGDVSPINLSSGSQTHQSRMFKPTFMSEYSAWTSAQKDGNHFRQWTIDITDAIVNKSITASVFIVMKGSYYNTSANGTLAKLITFRKNATNYINNFQEDYVVAQSPCSTEYVISGLLKESDRFKFKVINKAPANNNYPVHLLIDLTVDASTNLNTCTLTEEIVEGWPEWAGTKDATIKVTASGSPVLTEETAATVAKTGDYSDLSGTPTFGTAAFKDVPASGNATSTQVVMGSDSRLTDSRTPKSHTHGNITNGGALQTNDVAVANGDKLVVTDSSDSNKVARTSVTFDGSTTTKALTPKGTFEAFAKSGDITTAIQTLDASVVHKNGSETITGLKTFNNAMSPRHTGDGFMKQSKVFIGSVITPYADWEASQKDGNHFRAWTIDLTSVIATASTHGNIVVKLMGSYYNAPAIGALQKVLTFQVNSGNVIISKGDYTVAQTPCSEEFAISDVFKSGSGYVVQVVNRNPTVNNYPLRLEVEMFNRYASAVFDSVTMTESIISGWPSWAGDKNTPVRVTASGSPVLTDISVTTGDNPGQIKVAGQNVSVNGWKNIYVLDGPAASYESNAIYLI